MLRLSMGFLCIGLFSMLAGVYQIEGISFEMGRLLLFFFLGLAFVSFIGSLLPNKFEGLRMAEDETRGTVF